MEQPRAPASADPVSGELSEVELLLSGNATPAALSAAAEKMRRVLRGRPDDPAALHLFGRICFRLGRYEEAENGFRAVLERSPNDPKARWMFALTLYHRNNWQSALRELETLLAESPDNPDYLNLKAESLLQIGEYDGALACYERLVARHPTADNCLYYGHALRARGLNEQCVAAYRSALAVKPDFGEVYWSLANLKTFRFSSADIDTMRAMLGHDDLEPRARAALHFALGKAHEDEKQYPLALEEYQNGNALWRKGLRYNPEGVTSFVRQCKAIFTPEFFRERSGAGCSAADPMFIVSLPRSGSTLVEQVLASHSVVEGTRELPTLTSLAEHLARQSRSGRYPDNIRELDANRLRWAGEEYIARTRIHRKAGRPFFVDKMTGNFLHIGLLHLILPNAKVIDVRRHPLGCGVANFKHFYLQGAPFAFDFAEIGRYYRDYVELMAHFDAVLPGRVHRVFYEDLVSDPEQEIRRLLEYCGLPFEEACLRFYETDRGVFTPSATQVRQPIYAGALEQWRNYEPWLGPMKAALGDVLTSYPAVPRFSESLPPSGTQWRVSAQRGHVWPNIGKTS
ncbi:MAG TPA: sulfotransferase [Rhizomicrobium sp.]|jgi:tetratricopeptide (TPR) repeat protein|nr:sulfotransferase [Rhizomicrobium sp.]